MRERNLKKFPLEGQYESLFRTYGIKIEEALRKAGLSEDLFRRKRPMVTESQYFSLMEAMVSLSEDKMLAIQFGTSDRIETFSPPIFAAYCSRDGDTCLQRLAEYKCLIGSVRYQITEKDDSVLVGIVHIHEGIFHFLRRFHTALLKVIVAEHDGEFAPCDGLV